MKIFKKKTTYHYGKDCKHCVTETVYTLFGFVVKRYLETTMIDTNSQEPMELGSLTPILFNSKT